MSDVEELLTRVYGPDETSEKTADRNRVVNADGTINGFQMTGLRNAAKQAATEQEAVSPASPPALDSIPEAPEYQDLVPEPIEGYEDRVDVVRLIKERLSIEGAVRQFGKAQASFKSGSRTESIMVRCPFPAHADNDPSAWINTKDDVWYCGVCAVGGDQIDFFAAAQHGLRVSEWHRDKTRFREILFELAELLGIDPEPPQAIPPDPVPEPEPQPPTPAPTQPEPDPVPNEPDEPITISVDEVTAGIDWDPRDSTLDFEEHNKDVPHYDWKNLNLAPGTFFHDWMLYHEKNFGWCPPEYFMMLGFQAIGLACGHETTTRNGGQRLTGSTMFAIIGPSQYGKTTALGRLRQLMRLSKRAKFDAELGTGVKVITTPGSPEAMIPAIRTEIQDPLDPKKMMEVPTTCLIVENELDELIAKSGRKGSGASRMKSRIQELHDFSKDDDEPEVVLEDHTMVNGHRVVHDCFVSAAFLTQTDALREHVQKLDLVSGFYQRLHPVFGVKRERRSQKMGDLPFPGYVDSFDNLWDVLRLAGKTTVRLSDDCLDVIDDPKYFGEIQDLGLSHSILARLEMFVHRFAFLLAVNDQRRTMSVEIEHYDTAMYLVKNYTIPCYGYFMNSAKTSESKDLGEKLVAWCREHHAKTRAWPSRGEFNRQRFWKNAPELMQEIVLQSLERNQEMVHVVLKSGGRRTTVYVVVDVGTPWAAFANSAGVVYDKDAFYASS